MLIHLYIIFSFKILTKILLAPRFTLLVTYKKIFFSTRSIEVLLKYSTFCEDIFFSFTHRYIHSLHSCCSLSNSIFQKYTLTSVLHDARRCFSKKVLLSKAFNNKFLYSNMFIAFAMRMFIKKYQGYPENNASKLTWFEKLDFKMDLLTSLRSRDVKTKENSLRNVALHK